MRMTFCPVTRELCGRIVRVRVGDEVIARCLERGSELKDITRCPKKTFSPSPTPPIEGGGNILPPVGHHNIPSPLVGEGQGEGENIPEGGEK